MAILSKRSLRFFQSEDLARYTGSTSSLLQGMFIVSLPYGVMHGGYWGILAMVGVAHICCHTGKILVECLYEPDPETGQPVKVRFSYNEVAQECFGKRCVSFQLSKC